MYRLFTIRDRGGTEKFVLHNSERETLIGLFERAGVGQDIIHKITSSEVRVDLTADECQRFARRMRTTLSLRRVIWEQQRSDRPGLAAGGSSTFTRTLDTALRGRISTLAAFMEKAAGSGGCYVDVKNVPKASNG